MKRYIRSFDDFDQLEHIRSLIRDAMDSVKDEAALDWFDYIDTEIENIIAAHALGLKEHS